VTPEQFRQVITGIGRVPMLRNTVYEALETV
jgi:2-iminoacetate synthase ThiH